MSNATDNSWLDLGDAPGAIRAAKTLVNEKKRGAAVNMLLSGKGRAWHSDGKYIWFRRKSANPATTERLDGHVARGEIKFVVTSDDVEMYEVTPNSPFYRSEQSDLLKLNFQTVFYTTGRAAKRQDWSTFVDGIQEMAARIKGAVYSDGQPADGNFAKLLYSEQLIRLFRWIEMAGGPARDEVDREVAAIQQKRGIGRGSGLILPPAPQIARANRVR